MISIAIVMLFAHQIRAQRNSLANISWKVSPSPDSIWSTKRFEINLAASIGYYQNEIFIIAGSQYKYNKKSRYSVTTYNIGRSSFGLVNKALHTTPKLNSPELLCFSQSWTQSANNLYFIPHQSTNQYNIFKLNLETFALNQSWTEIQPKGQYDQACLASFGDNWLFIIGAKIGAAWNAHSSDTVSIYDIDDDIWKQNNLIQSRSSAACIVNDYIEGQVGLYAIGGETGSDLTHWTPSQSIERMDILSLATKLYPWEEGMPLISAALNARAVAIDEYIMVISGGSSRLVQLINTMTGEVELAQPLNKIVYASSVIKVNNVIYSFGNHQLETLTLPESIRIKPLNIWLNKHSNPSNLREDTAIQETLLNQSLDAGTLNKDALPTAKQSKLPTATTTIINANSAILSSDNGTSMNQTFTTGTFNQSLKKSNVTTLPTSEAQTENTLSLLNLLEPWIATVSIIALIFFVGTVIIKKGKEIRENDTDPDIGSQTSISSSSNLKEQNEVQNSHHSSNCDCSIKFQSQSHKTLKMRGFYTHHVARRNLKKEKSAPSFCNFRESQPTCKTTTQTSIIRRRLCFNEPRKQQQQR